MLRGSPFQSSWRLTSLRELEATCNQRIHCTGRIRFRREALAEVALSHHTMTTFIEFLEWAAKLGLWDFLTFVLAVVGAVTAVLVFTRRRYERFSLYPSYRIGTGHSLFPNVIYFSARNLGDAPIVVCRPNFRPSKHLLVDDTAHGNLDTEDYELKFRSVDSAYNVVQGHSYTTILLRHRESAVAYVPIARSYDSDSFKRLIGNKILGWITFDIVTVGEGKPRVVRMKQKVKRVAIEAHDLKLGFDPARPAT